MNGLNSRPTNSTFRCLSNHACMNRSSTIGKNMNYIMGKYKLPKAMKNRSFVSHLPALC